MKKSKLRQIIREEIQNLAEKINPNKEYTAKDLYKFLKSGEEIAISTDGGNSSQSFKKERWHKTDDEHIEEFKRNILNNRYFKNKKFIPNFKFRDNYFILKDSETGAGDFYDKMQTRRGGGIYKGD